MKKFLSTVLLTFFVLNINAQAPADSKYGWLNNALFVCAPEWSQDFKGIVLNVWKVK